MTISATTSTGKASVQTTSEEISVNQQVWDSTMEQVDKTSDRLEAQMALMRRNIDTMDDLNQAISKLSLSQEANKKDGDRVTITTEMKDAALTAGVWVEGADTELGSLRWDASEPSFIPKETYDRWVSGNGSGNKPQVMTFMVDLKNPSVGANYYDKNSSSGSFCTATITAAQFEAAGKAWKVYGDARSAALANDPDMKALMSTAVLTSTQLYNLESTLRTAGFPDGIDGKIPSKVLGGSQKSYDANLKYYGVAPGTFLTQAAKDAAIAALTAKKNSALPSVATITKMSFADYAAALDAVTDKSDSNTIKKSMNLSQVTKLIAKIRADLEKLQGSSQLDSTQLQRMNSAYNTLLQMLSELLSKFSKTTDAIVGALK